MSQGFTLQLTPSGQLLLMPGADKPSESEAGAWLERVRSGFAENAQAGLFALAATRPTGSVEAGLAYWREFACLYLGEFCKDPTAPKAPVDGLGGPWASWLWSVPPMRGAEYLSAEVLERIWWALHAWVESQVAELGQGSEPWLARYAPDWHQVGRVCFHLAERKGDARHPFAFLATYAPQMGKKGRVQYQPLSKALQAHAGSTHKADLAQLLAPVHLASQTSPFVKELLDSGDLFHPLAWTPGQAYRFLQQVPDLEAKGLLVRLPNWWKKRARAQVSVTMGESQPDGLGLDQLLDFQVGVGIGAGKLSAADQKKLLQAREGLMLLKGQWVEVDRDKLTQALDHWRSIEELHKKDGVGFLEGMRMLAGAPTELDAEGEAVEVDREWTRIEPGQWLSSILNGLRDPRQLASRRKKNGLKGELRPYQQQGHDWLWLLTSLGLGACLADDMGLGKTIQVLSLLLSIKQEKTAKADTSGDRTSGHRPSLLILPASLLANWKAEIERFAPQLRTCFVHPSETPRTEIRRLAKKGDEGLCGIDLVLTSYAMILRQKWMTQVDWNLVILDEAQAIKNPGSQQSRAIKKLESRSRIALTGTPLENSLADLWSLFDFLCPGLLGTGKKFQNFIKALEKRGRDRYAPLRKLIQPYLLRRLKTDKTIIDDLPDKTEQKAHCGLTPVQTALYSQSVDELAKALETIPPKKRRGMILSYLLRFKQICNHPSQVLGDDEYSSEDSGKFLRLSELCQEIAARQERVLVFTQFREMCAPLAEALATTFGREGLVLHGGTRVQQRRALVEAFLAEGGPPFFVLSLKAGGTGLNLTAASHVIHFDRWWNPAVENQATDRAFRIGQHRNVLVHKFLCEGTVEEQIDHIIERKARLADDIVSDDGEKALTEVSDEELLAMVRLDLDRASL